MNCIIVFVFLAVFVFICFIATVWLTLLKRRKHKVEKMKYELGVVYEKLVDGAFQWDEQFSKQKFIDYFIADKFKKYHHIKYDDNYTYYIAWNDMPDCDAVCILAFVVKKSLRNKGLGTEIFHNWFYEMGNPRIIIEVDNADAMRFWEREGFIVNEEYVHFQPALDVGKKPVRMPLAFNFDPENIKALETSMLKYGFGKDKNGEYI